MNNDKPDLSLDEIREIMEREEWENDQLREPDDSKTAAEPADERDCREDR